MPWASELAKLLAGTQCPHFRFRKSLAKRYTTRHEYYKRQAAAALEARARQAGWSQPYYTAGVTGPEASVILAPVGVQIRGRIDVLLVSRTSDNSIGVMIAEVKGSPQSAGSLDAAMQAAIYSLPMLECSMAGGECARLRGRRLTVKGGLGVVEAVLNASAGDGSYGISSVKAYTVSVSKSGHIVVFNVTRVAETLLDSLRYGGFQYPAKLPSDVRIPGPYCVVCEHYSTCVGRAGVA